MKYYMYMIFIQGSFFMKIINLDVKLIISQKCFFHKSTYSLHINLFWIFFSF